MDKTETIAFALSNMYDFDTNVRVVSRLLVNSFFINVDPYVETFFPLLRSYYETK